MAWLPQNKDGRSRYPRGAGFTIIETFVAVSLIMTTLVLFLDAVRLSIRMLDNAERKYVAAKLAQEGVELFISKRNNNVLCIGKPSCVILNWQEDLYDTDSCASGSFSTMDDKGFRISSDDPTILLPGNNLKKFNKNFPICYNASGDRFIQMDSGTSCSAGTAIRGDPKRRIRTCSQSSERLLVQSIIEWSDRQNNLHTALLEKVLFDTQP